VKPTAAPGEEETGLFVEENGDTGTVKAPQGGARDMEKERKKKQSTQKRKETQKREIEPARGIGRGEALEKRGKGP